MLVIVFLSLAVGVALGVRYGVLCLIPTTLVGIIALAASTQVSDASVATIGCAVVLALSIQAGYVGGILLGGGGRDAARDPEELQEPF